MNHNTTLSLEIMINLQLLWSIRLLNRLIMCVFVRVCTSVFGMSEYVNSTTGIASWLEKKPVSPGVCSELTFGPGQPPLLLQLIKCFWKTKPRQVEHFDIVKLYLWNMQSLTDNISAVSRTETKSGSEKEYREIRISASAWMRSAFVSVSLQFDVEKCGENVLQLPQSRLLTSVDISATCNPILCSHTEPHW